MGEGTRAAEERLFERMARARAKHAAHWRFRSFVLPIGLLAAGVFASVEIDTYNGVYGTPMAPIIAAAVVARVLGGITAGRVAALIGGPLSIYLAFVTQPLTGLWYLAPCNAITFTALCVDGASLLRWIGPNRRSAASHADAPKARHTPTR